MLHTYRLAHSLPFALPTLLAARRDYPTTTRPESLAPPLRQVDISAQALANFWQLRTSMLTARHQLVAGSLNNLFYAIGGLSGSSVADALTTVEVYSPLTNNWVRRAPLPDARVSAAGAVAIDGQLYVFTPGLATQPGLFLHRYNPATARTTAAPMLRAGQGIGGAAAGSLIYVVGGRAPSGTITTLNQAYQP